MKYETPASKLASSMVWIYSCFETTQLHLQSSTVINHGIPEHTTEGALEMAKNFFSLPIEAKMEVGAQCV